VLLLADSRVQERRAAARGGLAPLCDSLMRELEPLLGASLYIPEEKALLSRAGGRCEADGSQLEFDPWSPHEHVCPMCGRTYSGESYHRAWITWYQLWLAERALQAALFHVLRGEPRHAELSRRILTSLATRYLSYPNRDNVLGPTRLFFSTYLESIWLLQICLAADCLRASGDAATFVTVRDRIVAPSSALIAEFDEGMSNRQVWNNAALLASATLTGDSALAARAVGGASGLLRHLEHGLLGDSSWYEGENYHLFALRGLWYGVTMLEASAESLPTHLRERFDRAFAIPFVTALPDFTFPSRKDSQYAVSLRQWRIAEMAELGFARRPDPIVGAALARLYDPAEPRCDTGRSRSAADVERNGPPSGLRRSDLGWRSLLHARPELPALLPASPRSALLESQGYAVFRREDDVYVGFEFGQSGGGHGHPDRLNVTLYQGDVRWLDDLGTGSYVDPSLHWYRSTLAHNAPLVNDRSQPLRDGTLVAYDEREALGWIVGELTLPEDDAVLERTVVVAPDYFIEELTWTAKRPIRVDVPWHLDGEIVDAPVAVEARRDGHHARLIVLTSGARLSRASGPGQPPSTQRSFVVLRADGREGRVRTLMTWSAAVRASVSNDGAITVELENGERHVHHRDDKGWHVELNAGGARSSVDLGGFRPRVEASREPPMQSEARRRRVTRARPAVFDLGESHYRRSEPSWEAAGRPTARITLAAEDASLHIVAEVRAGDPHFSTAAENPLDNEHPDTLGAGVQLYVRTAAGRRAWSLVPEPWSERVRVRRISADADGADPVASWRQTTDGYEITIDVPRSDRAVDLDLIINETTADRSRRRGQLVLSGAKGEWVYLRGDRHDWDHLIPFEIAT